MGTRSRSATASLMSTSARPTRTSPRPVWGVTVAVARGGKQAPPPADHLPEALPRAWTAVRGAVAGRGELIGQLLTAARGTPLDFAFLGAAGGSWQRANVMSVSPLGAATVPVDGRPSQQSALDRRARSWTVASMVIFHCSSKLVRG